MASNLRLAAQRLLAYLRDHPGDVRALLERISGGDDAAATVTFDKVDPHSETVEKDIEQIVAIAEKVRFDPSKRQTNGWLLGRANADAIRARLQGTTIRNTKRQPAPPSM